MLEFSEREEDVVALHIPIEPLKTRSGQDPVPRCEPRTYQPISRRLSHCAIGAGNNDSRSVFIKHQPLHHKHVTGIINIVYIMKITFCYLLYNNLYL